MRQNCLPDRSLAIFVEAFLSRILLHIFLIGNTAYPTKFRKQYET